MTGTHGRPLALLLPGPRLSRLRPTRSRKTCPSATVTASRITSACSTATPARPASPSARAPHCSTAVCPRRRPAPYSITSPRATASDRPGGLSASIAIPSSAWPAPPAIRPMTLTTSSWLFPPRTSEVQLDEAWSFVAKKQKNCDPADSADDHKGDWWDHVAYDAEHKLVLACDGAQGAEGGPGRVHPAGRWSWGTSGRWRRS